MASPGAAGAAVFRPSNAVVLYRRILRSIRGFEDGGQRWYYRNWSRGHIQSHSDEDDPERLRFLLAKGEEHRLWVIRKYKIQDPYAAAGAGAGAAGGGAMGGGGGDGGGGR